MNEYDELIGSNLKKARKSKGYTQEVLAEKVNIGDKHLSRIEQGRVKPSLHVFIKLCEVLEVGADYILFGKVTINPDSPFNKLIEGLTPDQVLKLEKIVEILFRT